VTISVQVSFIKLSNRIESKNRFVSVNRIESNQIIFPRFGMLYSLYSYVARE